MKGWFKQFFAAGLAIAVVAMGAMVVQPAYADAVKDRVAAMKSISKANKAMQAAVKKGNKAMVEKEAMMIVSLAEKIPALFPKGTDRGTLGAKATRAKPEIWAKWDDFQARAGKLKSVAMQVASAAKEGGNMAAAAKGMGGACGACHKAFRGPKAK